MRTLVRVFLATCLRISLLSDVCSEEMLVREGDMVALQCPQTRGMGQTASWASYNPQKRILSSDTTSTAPLVIHKRSLVLLSVSASQQGNYSCSLGNNTFWFKLVVLSHGDHEGAQYTTTCYSHESCTLRCPISSGPGSHVPNMTRHGVTWTKGARTLLSEAFFFQRVEETDEGTYTCTRTYRFNGQTYNMTFTNKLYVKLREPLPDVQIISPQDGNVFEIELGSVFVANCTATLSSDFDEVFWMTDQSSVDTDTNLRVFSNSTIFVNAKGTFMTTLLIFKEVVKDDLSENFTCKLESVSVPSSFVTIFLEQKKQETTLVPFLILVAVLLVTAVAALMALLFHFHNKSVPPPVPSINHTRENLY